MTAPPSRLIMMQLPILAVLAAMPAGCGWEDDLAELDELEQRRSALTNEGVWMGAASGRVYTTTGGVSYENVQSYHIYQAMLASSYRTNLPKRFTIVDWADLENTGSRCGSVARARYGADSGDKWCSEYARWIFRTAGLRNIRYCNTHVITCLDYVYLSEADTVDDMVQLFAANGGWVKEGDITLSKIEPGDYLALTGSSGEKKSHSAVVMAIAANGRYIYTSEGNVGDCVRFMRRDLFVGGVLNPEIDGLGKVNVAF